MLLDNYIKSYNQNLLVSWSGSYVNDLNDKCTLPDGTSIKLPADNFGGINPITQLPRNVYTTLPTSSPSSTGDRYIVFGDGNTPVSLNDYTISGNVVPNIKYTVLTGALSSEGVRQTYGFTNNNSTDVTIKEVCIFGSWAKGSANSYKVAVWREVFETPLVVPRGDTFLYNINVVWSI